MGASPDSALPLSLHLQGTRLIRPRVHVRTWGVSVCAVFLRVHTHVGGYRARLLAPIQAVLKPLWNAALKADGLGDKAAQSPDREGGRGSCHGRLGRWCLLISGHESTAHNVKTGSWGREPPSRVPGGKHLCLNVPPHRSRHGFWSPWYWLVTG